MKAFVRYLAVNLGPAAAAKGKENQRWANREG
jgi:hypothetical protein